MAKYDNDFVTEYTPRMGNGFTRWIGSAVLRLLGWKIVGQFPKEKKLLFIGAPHTSNWDLIIALAGMMSLGLKASWMMKKEAFFWPLGGLWKSLGGVPIDRASKNDITSQMSQWYKENETAWLGLTPEGTRSKVDKFKKGYLRIAYAAGVPIFIVAINGANKEIVLDKIWDLSFDTEIDNRKIKAYYDQKYKGIKAENG